MTATRPPSRPERVFRRLLRLLPGEFRGDFGDSMAQDFRDRDRDLTGRARASFWSREVPGVIRTVVAQHAAGVWRDVRFTLRMMARSPGFTAAAVLMLAVGTGANAAMFSVIDAVMLRSAYRDAGRIAALQEQAPGKSPTNAVPISHLDMLSGVPAFEAVAGITVASPVMTGGAVPRRINLECVSASMFRLLDVPPALGRVLGPDDDRVGASPVVILSYRAWKQDFSGEPDIVGRTVTLDGNANTVIGVMPEGFIGSYLRNRTDGWAALMPGVGQSSAAGCRVRGTEINAIVRVRPSRTLDTAIAELDAMGLAARLPLPTSGVQPARIVLERADDFQFESVRTPFLALLGAVGCVLLIACANVANLQLERLVGRRREMAVRLALGATRGRIVRQTLVENLIVSVIGAACGVIAARVTLQAIVSMIPATVPHVQEITMDVRTLAVTFLAALVAGLAVGVVPAVQASKPAVATDLNQSSGRLTGGSQWIRRALVIVEVALSVVLLIGAALMLRTFLILRPDAPGFAVANRTVAQLSLPGGWKVDHGRERFVKDVMSSFGEIPGVTSVSGSSYLPLSGTVSLDRIEAGGTEADVWSSWVTTNYFRDMNMAIARGRVFDERDGAGATPVAMINEALAARFWPAAEPLGQVIDVRAPDGSLTSRQIVGILRTTRSWGSDTERRSELFVPYAQEPGSSLFYFIVTTGGPAPLDLAPQIRARVAALRPDQVVDQIEPLQAVLDRAVARPRFGVWLFGVFAAMAVGLAALGLGAVVTWWVAQRQREIGIRMALGASAERVAGLILGQGLQLALGGVGLGLVAAAAATRLLSAWLYGVAPLDPAAFASCAAAMIVVAATAAYIPARRAARIDPIITLRTE